MLSLFVIHEKNTNSYCTGQTPRSFSTNLQDAATFVSKANAEKAIKKMFPNPDEIGLAQYALWGVDFQSYHNNLSAYVEQLSRYPSGIDQAKYVKENVIDLKCEMSVVEVRLEIVSHE